MGNGGFTIEYPPLHELATSKNPVIHAFDHFLTYLNPEPHRRTFMKPFMRQDVAGILRRLPQSAPGCSGEQLPLVPRLQRLRQLAGQRSFRPGRAVVLLPRQKFHAARIATCRWWLRTIPAIVDGKIHSHRFPAANTAVAYVNQDADQLKAEEDFLKSGFITVDIFAASPVDAHKGETAMLRRAGDGPQVMSGFAVGEEAEQQHDVVIREVGQVAAPIDKAGAVFVPGSTARVDVVVRTRKIGHFFPGGTVDAFDVWLELRRPRRRRPRDFLERRGGGQRPRPG